MTDTLPETLTETTALVPPALDRRAFVAAAGIGGLAASLGPVTAAAAAAGRRDLTPMDLDFSIVDQQRPVDLVADNFVRLRDSFTSARNRYTTIVNGGKDVEVRSGGGRMRISGRKFDVLLRSPARQVAPYAAVVVSVRSFSGSQGQDAVVAGLVKDAENSVLAWYDHAAGKVGIDVTRNGETTTVSTVEARFSAPMRLAFGLTSTTVVALVDSGKGGFKPLVKANLAEVDGAPDLRRPANLAKYRDSFGARASSGEIVLDKVEAGYFGQLGLRDPHVVTEADGTPYVRDGKLYMTFTQAGLAFFETAHWGVWTVDLKTYELEQVGNLFFRREGLDAVLGDHAGHIVLDEKNKRWIVANSTWGDFDFESVEINYTTVPSRVDLLHGVHVLRTKRLKLPLGQLPTAAVGQWDPHIVKIGRRWYVGFVNAREFFKFYPALARSAPGADFTDLELVGADSTKVETEGTVMQKFGDRWYLLASNGDASPEEIKGQYPVYDLKMNQVGVLDAPHPTNIPWPMIVPIRTRGNRTRWLMITFEGTQLFEPLLGYGTHGDVIVMKADRLTRGYPFK